LDVVFPKDPAMLLLGIYPKDAPTYNNDTCYTMFIAPLLIIARSLKKKERNRKKKCSSRDEWIQKVIHLHNEILLSY
jgi:hypothetical protein